MKDVELVIKIPEGIMEYIKNNGCLAVGYNDEVAKAIKSGTPLPKYMEELKRRLLMEVDGGTDDRYLNYADICDRISDTIDTFMTESAKEEEREER